VVRSSAASDVYKRQEKIKAAGGTVTVVEKKKQ
jgi:hypothetical protein